MENQTQNRTLSELEVQELNFSKDFLKIILDFSEDLGTEPISVSKILSLVISKRNDDAESVTHKLLSNVIMLLKDLEKNKDNLLLNPKLEVRIALSCNCSSGGIKGNTVCVCSGPGGWCTCMCGGC